jgi:hypothetical protein
MVDCRWPGKDRRATASPRSAGVVVAPDFVGVYIEITHPFRLPVLSQTLTVTDHSVSLLEPRSYAL